MLHSKWRFIRICRIRCAVYRIHVLRSFHTHSINGHFPCGPAFAGTRMSPVWILLELRMMEVVVTTGGMTYKAPVKSSPPTNQHPVFFTGRMPFLSPNQQCQSNRKGIRPVKKLCVGFSWVLRLKSTSDGNTVPLAMLWEHTVLLHWCIRIAG